MKKLAFCILLVAACGGDGGKTIPDVPGPAPAAPPFNDGGFNYIGPKAYYLIGNALTPGHDSLTLSVTPMDDGVPATVVDAWIDGGPGVRLTEGPGRVFTLTADISALAAGQHVILLATDGNAQAFAQLSFYRTHPLYVVVSTDWDDADNSDYSLMLQEQLHQRHAELKLTHFVGPYTYTDPSVTEARRTELTDWVKGMRDTYGDEIGVHIHPYCNFIDTTTVPCRTTPSSVYPAGDTSGYTIIVASYTEDEFTTILQAATAIFEQRGLGTPTSFRAGGWTTELNTMKSLANAGYLVDSSANNWARLESSWSGYVLFDWNMEHWAPINDTSQPWYPSTTSMLADAAPHVPVLEVPDNGILVDYITGDEMIGVFEANWAEAPNALPVPRQLSIGFHPPNFNADYQMHLNKAMDRLDLHLASAGNGPVVYANLSDLVKVWPVPN